MGGMVVPTSVCSDMPQLKRYGLKPHLYQYRNATATCLFGPRVYPKGSLVIALVCVCLCVLVFVFIYPRDRSLVFLIFCMKLGHHKGTKVTEPDF